MEDKAFPGSPVIKTPLALHKCGLDTWSGTKGGMHSVVWPKKGGGQMQTRTIFLFGLSHESTQPEQLCLL